MKRFLTPLALLAAVAALSAPVSADTGRLGAYVLEPLGNPQQLGNNHQHGLNYGVGYAVAHVGPVRVSPLVDVASTDGNATFHLGLAETVGIGKHFDVGLAEVQRPGSTGFTRIGTSAVVGVRL
jgi:hypothetical protein